MSAHAEGGGGGDALGASVRSSSSSGERKRPSEESSSMGIGGAWSSSTASEVGLGTGPGAGARSGTGLGSTLVEDGDSEVPVAAGRESEGATIVAKRREASGQQNRGWSRNGCDRRVHGQVNRRSRSCNRAANARQSRSWAGATLRTEEDRERRPESGARHTGQRMAVVRS